MIARDHHRMTATALRRSTCAAWSAGSVSATAIAGIDLSVQPGEIHALLGPNGAGKTTLLRTLAGLVEPTAGTVRVAGIDAAKGPRGLRGMVGLRPVQRPLGLPAHLGRREPRVLRPPARACARRPAFARARAVLADVGLADRGDDPVNAWSHGMQQRLSVARALLTDPPVLLIDEATHDLDPEAAATVRELIAARAEQRHRGAVGHAAARRAARLRRRGDADVGRDRRLPRHGRGARRARACPDPARRHASELEQGYLAIVQGRGMSAAGAGRRGRKLPAFVRRDWKIALSYRAVFVADVARPRDADLRLLLHRQARRPGHAARLRRDGAELPGVRRRSASSSTSPPACCCTRSPTRCARSS